jgi:hypothetical protein
MPSAENDSKLRHIIKFPSEISDLAFSKAAASLAISSENALIVFHRIKSTGCFIPSQKNIREDVTHVVKSLAWSGPMKIEHKRPKLQERPLRTDVYKSWKAAQELSADTNYTICQHWKTTTKCDDCKEVEAAYNKREEIKISREVKDDSGTYLAKARGCFVEIWSSDDGNNMGTVGEKGERPAKRKMGEEIDSGKVKQAKVKSSNEDSDSEAHELIEITSSGRTLEKIMKSIET